MQLVPQFFKGVLAKALFRSAVVADIVPLSDRFRLVKLEGEQLRNVRWTPGDKIQINLGNLVCRTYTPIEWNATDGVVRFVVFLHGHGPGSDWASSIQSGSTCQILGPRSSLKLGDSSPTVFFGDETSLGAALAHQRACPEFTTNYYLFEVNSPAECKAVAEQLHLKGGKFIAKAEDSRHIVDIEQRMFEARMRLPPKRSRPAHWVFTGNAQSIQKVKGALRRNGFSPARSSTRPYWAHGRKGFD